MRVIVSPAAGVFRPLADLADLPELVAAGSAVGHVLTKGAEVPVVSPFSGVLVAVDAVGGERLEPYQRIAWLRAA